MKKLAVLFVCVALLASCDGMRLIVNKLQPRLQQHILTWHHLFLP